MLNNETLSLFLFSEDYSVRVLTDLQQTSATDTNSTWKYLSYIGSALKKIESVCRYKIYKAWKCTCLFI